MGLGWGEETEVARGFLLNVIWRGRQSGQSEPIDAVKGVLAEVQREIDRGPNHEVPSKAFQELLRGYYDSQKVVINEWSGDFETDRMDLMDWVETLSVRHLGEHFDFGDDGEIYDIDIEQLQKNRIGMTGDE